MERLARAQWLVMHIQASMLTHATIAANQRLWRALIVSSLLQIGVRRKPPSVSG